MIARLLTAVFLLIFPALPCFAQSSDQSTPPATPSADAPQPNTPAVKKVWTNENMPAGKPGVSVVGDGNNQNSRVVPNATADATTVKRISKSLETLQAQLEDVNKKLTLYDQFLHGEQVSTSERQLNKGVNREPVDQQMVKLQEKKKKIQAQISDLYDEARKKGIDSKLLP